MPQEDEAVGDGDIEQEVINILVEFPAPFSALVVPSQLVTVIHSSHEPVVQQWTWDGDPSFLLWTSPTAEGWQLVAIAVTTFLSCQAVALTLPL